MVLFVLPSSTWVNIYLKGTVAFRFIVKPGLDCSWSSFINMRWIDAFRDSAQFCFNHMLAKVHSSSVLNE